jgi:hypothetical protein
MPSRSETGACIIAPSTGSRTIGFQWRSKKTSTSSRSACRTSANTKSHNSVPERWSSWDIRQARRCLCPVVPCPTRRRRRIGSTKIRSIGMGLARDEYTRSHVPKPHTLVFVGGLGDSLGSVDYLGDVVRRMYDTHCESSSMSLPSRPMPHPPPAQDRINENTLPMERIFVDPILRRRRVGHGTTGQRHRRALAVRVVAGAG